MKKIRLGIIGTGIIARQHLKRYEELEGVEVVAACDIREEVLEKFCADFKIENKYADYRELLKRDDLDGVDVCLHNNLHAPISIDVMKSGKACYCEKPMAGSYKDALAMYDAAKVLGQKLHIQLSFLYGGSTYAAKQLINSGRLGKIYHARSCGFRRRGRPYVDGYAEKEFNSKYWAGGGALFDMGVYRISQILYLMNTPKLLRVSGQTYQEVEMDAKRRAEGGFNVEELGVGFAKFENNLSMDIIESWAIHTDGLGESFIVGNDGGIKLDPIKYFTCIDNMTMNATFEVDGDQYRFHQLDENFKDMDSAQSHWLSILRGKDNGIDTAKIALDTIHLSEGIYLSSELGREVTADEIVRHSKSLSLKEQETPFGTLTYTAHPFI